MLFYSNSYEYSVAWYRKILFFLNAEWLSPFNSKLTKYAKKSIIFSDSTRKQSCKKKLTIESCISRDFLQITMWIFIRKKL